MIDKEIKEMLNLARKARTKSYAPYSKFHVGACLKTNSGEFYLGCNIENAGYTATNCAERTAFFKAVSDGKTDFEKIAIMGGYSEETLDFCPPCGVCLQVMMEFCNPETFQIILGNSAGECKVYLLKELLPMGFGAVTLAQ